MSHNVKTPTCPHASRSRAAAPAEGHASAQPVLYLCGLNHVRTPLDLLERFTLNREQRAEWVRRLMDMEWCEQVLILSTCNRTEVYVYGRHRHCMQELRDAFLAIGGVDDSTTPTAPLYEHTGIEAARHLFAVGAGLDSMILGENQIKQQMREAVEASRKLGAMGSDLHRLVESAFRTGKRIRTETDLNVGTLCLGKASVLKGEAVLGGLEGRNCLVIGAGKIGRLAALAIAECHPHHLWIVNRTHEHAHQIAKEIKGAKAYGLDELPERMARADLIIGAAYAEEFMVRKECYERARRKNGRPKQVCMVDAAVPRILDPALGEVDDVELFDIEHLEDLLDVNRKRRMVAAHQGWEIVEEETEKYRTSLLMSELGPMIGRLEAQFDRVFDEEREELETGCPPEWLDKARISQRRIKQRILHEVIGVIKSRHLDQGD